MTKAQIFIGGRFSKLLLTIAIICSLFFTDLSFTHAQRGGGRGESGGSILGGGQIGHAPEIREAIQHNMPNLTQHVQHESPRGAPQHVQHESPRSAPQHVPQQHVPQQQIPRAVQPTHNPPAIQPQPVTQPVISAPQTVIERVPQPRENPTRTTQPRETQTRENPVRETQPRETSTRRENPTSQPARETRPRNEQNVPTKPAPNNPPSNTITNPLGNATSTPHSGSTGRMPVSENSSERVGGTPTLQPPIPAMTNDQVQEALESRGLRPRENSNGATNSSNSSRNDARRTNDRSRTDRDRNSNDEPRSESRPDGRSENRVTENRTENNSRSERGTRTSERSGRPERVDAASVLIDAQPSISAAVAAYDVPSSVVNINNGTVNFIRNDFSSRYDSYWTRDWYHYHPRTWWWSGPPHIWWHRPLWSNCFGFYTAGFFAGYCAGEILTPVPYYYGTNVVYQNGMVYINGVPYVSAQEYYSQAQQLAMQGAGGLPAAFTQTEIVQVAPAVNLDPTQTIPTPFAAQDGKTPAIPQNETDAQAAQTLDEKEWLPLGTFAVLKDPEQKEVTYILQLATNKDGKMRGNLVQIDTDEVRPLVGAVDSKTQRVALSDPKNPAFIIECGLWNLTQDTLTALIHQSNEEFEQRTLVRLTEPTEKKEENL